MMFQEENDSNLDQNGHLMKGIIVLEWKKAGLNTATHSEMSPQKSSRELFDESRGRLMGL